MIQLRLSASSVFAFTAAWLLSGAIVLAARPNILWLVAEDMSATLGCYGDTYADTPRIDRFAKESVKFTHAFATSPVCSPSRACLINGVIATTQGAHPMRSTYPLPPQMLGFPSLLRKRGYFTSNNSKTDYNSGHADAIIKASWDENGPEAHWRHRKPGQPFFSVFNFMTSHQSRTMVWEYDKFAHEVQSKLPASRRHDPGKAPIPPYYPDRPEVRRTIARFYDCVSVMDAQVGELLDQLDADGLRDSTFVFFFSDHGSGMPRHKRVLLDSGMHVPLLIRPPTGSNVAGYPAGATTRRLVCFEDFAATVLDTAKVERPRWMRGQSFNGRDEARRYVFGHRDRIDEAIDMARSARDQRYLYIRNYMPHFGYNQYSAWPDDASIQDALYDFSKTRGQTAAQRHFLQPGRAVEELYDCERDPNNLNNLADDLKYEGVLFQMRSALGAHVSGSRDLGFIPELVLLKIANRGPAMTSARKNEAVLYRAINAANDVGIAGEARWRANLSAAEPSVRYWGALAMSASPNISNESIAALQERLDDLSEAVRLEAAHALVRHGRAAEGLPILIDLLDHPHPTVVLHAARSLEMLGAKASPAYGAIERVFKKYEDVEGDPAWFIRFTTTGFLKRVPRK